MLYSWCHMVGSWQWPRRSDFWRRQQVRGRPRVEVSHNALCISFCYFSCFWWLILSCFALSLMSYGRKLAMTKKKWLLAQAAAGAGSVLIIAHYSLLIYYYCCYHCSSRHIIHYCLSLLIITYYCLQFIIAHRCASPLPIITYHYCLSLHIIIMIDYRSLPIIHHSLLIHHALLITN